MKDTASEMAAVAAEMAAPSEGSLPSTTPEPTPAEVTQPSETGTTAPVDTQASTQPSEGTKPRGPIPYDRHEAILKNTREPLETQLKELEWAKDVKRDQVETYRKLYEWADTDPVGFYEYFGRQLRQDPRYAQVLQPAAPTEAPKAEPADVRPEPDVLLEDGRMVYSHQGMERLLAWNNRQSEQRLRSEFGPVLDAHKTNAVLTQARTEASSILQEARTWEGFTQHEQAIKELMAKDGRVTLDSAYRRVVIPALVAEKNEARTKVRQEVLAELQNKPLASTTNPGAASVNPPKSYKGMSTEEIMRSVHAELSANR